MGDVSVKSGWLYKPLINSDRGSNIWRWTTPTLKDKILWDSGANTVDSIAKPAKATVKEAKFNFTPPPGPLGKTLTGISYRDVGAGATGTVATTTGTGWSRLLASYVGEPNLMCKWDLSIKVTPGTGLTNWDIEAKATDPITLSRTNFVDDTSGLTSFYLPVVLEDLNYEDGGGGLSMSYKTASGIVKLLNLSSSAESGVVASGDAPDFLSFYLINQPFENPMATGVRPYSLVELKNVLSARMSGAILTSPLMLGVLLENVPIPTGNIGPDDLVAEFHIASHLREIGQREQKRRDEREQEQQG